MNIEEYTDKYFWRTKKIVDHFGDTTVTYAYFMRVEVISALRLAKEFILEQYPNAKIKEIYPEGSIVPAETKMMEVTGSLSKLVMLENLILQKIGFSCLSAYNAYKISMAYPEVLYLDMHSRHSAGTDMNHLCTYGASIGSRTAKLNGAKGFMGGAQDATAHYFGNMHGFGTSPHLLSGFAKALFPKEENSTLQAVKMYMEAMPDENNITALVDYDGKEITDALAVAFHFKSNNLFDTKNLSIRLDTHGGRFAQYLNYEKSVELVCNWLHEKDEWAVVKKVLGEEVFDADSLDIQKDKVRKILFGTGVSAANVINMRYQLTNNGFHNVKILASSGFNYFKCKIFAKASVPVDIIGTGSFLPEKISDTYTTSDIIEYNGKKSVKVGREFLYA